MNNDISIDDLFREARKSDEYLEESAILSFTRSVLDRLDALKMTKRQLADLMKVSPAYVAKLIGGSNNFTLRTMVKVAKHLDCELWMDLKPAIAETVRPVDESVTEFQMIVGKGAEMKEHSAANYEDLALAA
jgi:plasmid maintenance system antidote protein VapI